jgi:hypothetical protein
MLAAPARRSAPLVLRLLGAALLGLALAPAGSARAQSVPVERLGALAARNIGPAGMSGRVAAVDVVLSDPTRIFVGSSTGGVFLSEDGGVSWEPVFDEQPVTPLERTIMEQASDALDRVLAEVNAVLTGPVPAYAEALRAAGYTPLPDPAPVSRGGG